MKKFLVSLYNRIFRKGKVSQVYNSTNYLEAYSKHTDVRVEQDPHAAIGGHWEEIGLLQFDFLKQQGLTSDKTMLDIGCGTLRGGRHFIRLLNKGNYTGIDISPKAIEYAQHLIREEELTDKNAILIVSQNKDLKFNEFAGKTFDFILAQSVFTHLMPEHIEECFKHVSSIMHTGSAFYFTYFRSADYQQINHKDFSYPFTFFKNLADKYNFSITDLTDEYKHPKKQNMLVIKLKG